MPALAIITGSDIRGPEADAVAAAAADRSPQTASWSVPGVRVTAGWDDAWEAAPLAIERGDRLAVIEGMPTATSMAVERALEDFLDGSTTGLETLRGPWVAVAVRTPGDVRIATDQLGRRPVYWTHVPGGVVAASEMRQILAHPAVRPEVDEVALALWLVRAVGAPEPTLVRDVQLLPGGHTLRLGDGAASTTAWWSPDLRIDDGPDLDSWIAELRTLTEQAVARSVPAGRFGAAVSGGLDSSLVSGILAAQGHRDDMVATMIRQPGLPDDETEYQDAMLEHLGIDGVSVFPGDEDYVAGVVEMVGRGMLPELAYQAEGRCLRDAAAARGIRAIVGGRGGDEVFARGRLEPVDLLLARRPGAALAAARRAPSKRRLAETTARRAVGLLLPEAVRVRRTALPEWLGRDFADRTGARAMPLRPRRVGLHARAAEAFTMRFRSSLTGQLTNSADVVSQRAGVTAIEPLLDVDLVERAHQIPAHLLDGRGEHRHVEREVAAPYVPSIVRNRRGKATFDLLVRRSMSRGGATQLFDDLELARLEIVHADAARGLLRALTDPESLARDEVVGGASAVARLIGAEVWLRALADAGGGPGC